MDDGLIVRGEHRLAPSDIDELDELDEISGDKQRSLVWCETHKAYEWHWLKRRD